MNWNWESPRNVAILVALLAVVSAVVGYQFGYELARRPPQVIILLQPGAAKP